MIVQIYEVTTCAEARGLGMIGVDHVGVLVGEGSFPREQTIEKAREIFAAIPAGSKAFALSLTHDMDLIARLTGALMPDVLHLGQRHSIFPHRNCEHSKRSFRKSH